MNSCWQDVAGEVSYMGEGGASVSSSPRPHLVRLLPTVGSTTRSADENET